jgi:hypothetical protein
MTYQFVGYAFARNRSSVRYIWKDKWTHKYFISTDARYQIPEIIPDVQGYYLETRDVLDASTTKQLTNREVLNKTVFYDGCDWTFKM